MRQQQRDGIGGLARVPVAVEIAQQVRIVA